MSYYSRSRSGSLALSPGGLIRCLAVSFVVLATCAVVLVYLAPLSGWEWTGGLAAMRCATPGLCGPSLDGDPPEGQTGVSRVEFLSIGDLAACATAPEGCDRWVSDPSVTVALFIADAHLSAGGVALTLDRPLGPYRYAVLGAAETSGGPPGFLCVYSRSVAPALEAARGDRLVVSLTLWPSGADRPPVTLTPEGAPSCRVHLVIPAAS